MGSPERVVLDTNTALALWWFADPKLAPLAAAITAQRIQPIASPPLVAEWRAILLRLQGGDGAGINPMPPQAENLSLTHNAAPETRCTMRGMRAHAQFQEWIQCVDHPDATWLSTTPLPRCRDPEDQKFLECAWFHHATWLITRDKALLRLARRRQLPPTGGTAIVTPEAWVEAWLTRHDPTGK